MSFQAMTWAVKQKVGNATGKAVLLMLANYADENGSCYPGQDKLAKECECSSRTVREWLDKFETMGLIVRQERRREDGYRTSDLIVMQLEKSPEAFSPENNSPENGAHLTGNSRTSHRQEIPSNLLVEPSENRQPRAHTHKGLDVDGSTLQAKLIEAAGDKIQPHGVFDCSPIFGLLAAEVDLEADILPAIRAKAAQMRAKGDKPASKWSFFVGPIQDAYNNRLKAAEGLAKPVRAITPDAELAPDALEAEWEKRLKYARRNSNWISAVWGPMPGDDGCRVPSNLLQPTDGKDRYGVRWDDQSRRDA